MTTVPAATTVLIVDDQTLVRDGFTRIVDAQPDMNVVGIAPDGRQAIDLSKSLCPDIILMDVRMPGIDGIEATRAIVGDNPNARVLGLTTFDSDAYALRMLKAGATGFVLKDSTADQLVDAIRSVFHGTSTVSASTARRLLAKIAEQEAPQRDHTVLQQLTNRESAVFKLVVSGMSNLEIANHLGISEVTVKTHVGHVLSKLQVRDRVRLVLWAHRHGILSNSPSQLPPQTRAPDH